MFKKIFSIVLMLVIFLNNPLVIFAQSLNTVEIPEGLIGGMGFIEIPYGGSGDSRYLLMGNQSQMWVTESSIWLTKIESIDRDFLNPDEALTPLKKANINIQFPSATSGYQLIAERPMPGKVSFLKGYDRSDWQTDLQLWGQLRYQNLFPGVDLVIRSVNDGFEWNYEIQNPSIGNDLHLKIIGADGVKAVESGEVIQTEVGNIALPILTTSGLEISSTTIQYVEEDSGVISIYPVKEPSYQILNVVNSDQYTFGTFLGGSATEEGAGLDLDGSGNIYLSGSTVSADFPVTAGAFSTSFALEDAFIAKIDPTIPELVYATFIGGSGTDNGYELAVENNIAYLVGETDSLDFPLETGEVNGEAFGVALNSAGNDLVYSRLIGGSDWDRGYALDVENGFAYFTGISYSADFPVTNDSNYKNGGDIFVTKLASDGTTVYQTLLGGSAVDAGQAIAVQNGVAWLTGETGSNQLGGVMMGIEDIFVAKINAAGDKEYAKLFGGRGDDRGYGIALDDAGDVYVTGMISSSEFVMMEGSFGGLSDSFLLKVNQTGTIYSTFLGGSGSDRGSDITIDNTGGVIITGNTQSSDFPVTGDAFQSTYAGGTDAYVTRYFLAGPEPGHRTYSTYLGGSGFDQGFSLMVDDSIYTHIVGTTTSSDFPVTADALYPSINGSQDAFLSVMPVGPLPVISIQKTTNGLDSDQAPGQYVYPGTSIDWEYIVNNIGEVTLTEIHVTDSQGVTVSCPETSLIAGDSMTCTASGTAVADQYSNLGTVTARTPYDTTIGDTDASHYFGAVPETTLVKKTNDVIVTQPSDLYIEETGNITWTYDVTNSGNVDLSNVIVVDDNGTPGDINDDITVCTIPALAAGATDTTSCALNGDAVPGPYSNIAVVVGTPPGGLDDVSDQDVSYYFGSAPGISLVKKLDGVVTTAPGPYLLKDDPITWTYEVYNTGNVELTNVTVIDDNGTADIGDDITICSGLTIAAGGSDLSNCSLPDTVNEGSYHNVATVTGTPPVGSNVTATSDGYYFGSNPIVTIEYSVNDDVADSSPGLYVLTGSTLNLNYLVTNAGNVDLTGILVTDGVGNSITCPETTLLHGDSMTCTATMTALSDQQNILANVTATPPSPLANIQASDPIYYFGSSPSLTLDKKTNDQQGDSVPGVYVLTGSTVNWSYLVTNTGNVTLTGVTVVDDNGTPANSADDFIPTGCEDISLVPDEQVTCAWSDTAVEGQYTNTADVTGNPPAPLSQVNASDTSHYFGTTLSVSLVKQTNGDDAETTPGPLIAVGDPVDWTYSITNNSNVPVDFTIVDVPAVTITCDKNALAVGENIICTASGTAVAGQYTNTATVTVTPPVGLAPFEESDTSHYFGVITGVEIVKSTNGQDANSTPGPYIMVGDPVNWTYQVTNTGNVVLTGVVVTDDQGVTVSCPQTTLAASESMTCTASGTSVAGQYTNTGSVTADPPTGFSQVSDTDISHYFGGDAGINIEKYTNSDDNTAAPGIYILVGDTVTWTYRIENTGNVDLENVVVRDDKGTEDLGDDFNCPIAYLTVGAVDTTTCFTSELAEAGQYSNTAYVSADIVNLDGQVFDQDSSWYFGANPSIQIVKLINGQDVSEPPGPYIPVGEAVNFAFELTNTETDYDFYEISLTNDSGITPICDTTTLLAGESTNCTADGVAGTGQQNDVFEVKTKTSLAYNPDYFGELTEQTTTYYYGYSLGINLEKYTNGKVVSDPSENELAIDSQVTWDYEVTNTSNVAISEVSVNDIPEGVINCPKATLASSETMVCSKIGTVQEGDYQNDATVSADFVASPEVTEHISDTAISYYRGIPAFSIFIPLIMR